MIESQESLAVDARGLSCPQPVIETRRALTGKTSGVVNVLVDTGTQRDNIVRLGAREGWNASVETMPDGGFQITLKK